MLNDEDEVQRRARKLRRAAEVADAQRKIAENRLELRQQALLTATATIVAGVAARLRDCTQAHFATTHGSISCLAGTHESYREHLLFTVEVSEASRDPASDEPITFNCMAYSPDWEDLGGDPECFNPDLPADTAIAFGVEAVLDGMAQIVAGDVPILEIEGF